MLVQAWLRVNRRIKWRLACVAAPLAFAFAALSASPASAIVITLKSGKKVSYEAIAGAPAASKFDDFFGNLDYSGGPVMPSNTNYVIAWQPSGYAGGSFPAAYVSGVSQFFSDLGSASGQATNSESILMQYNDSAGHVAAYQSSLAVPALVDNHPLPPSGCSAAPICITDAQIQAELSAFMSAQGLPRDLNHEYFLLTPPSLTSCFDGSGSSPCSGNVDLRGYCAYHSASTTAGGSFIYAYIPDLATLSGCDPFYTHGSGFCPSAVTCHYPNGPNSADGVLSAVSHEHAESLTDPQPNNGWTDWGFGNGPEELGDKCNNDAFNDPNLQTQQSGSNWTPYNYTINGNHYLLQREWSNQGHACAHSFTPNGTVVHASFTQTASIGDSVSFDASGSSGASQYVWQFNDGSGQQTYTQETTSPTISWSFPHAGGYAVALTVMASDGTSNGTAHTAYAVDAGPSPTFSAPAAFAGIPAAFDGGRSSDPNPSGGIVTYSWDFGDGTTGSGRVANHIFSRTGFYTVTLTVQDNYFAVSSLSRNVMVGHLPRASLGPRSGRAGTAIHFTAMVPDLAGTTYRWKFGDGTTGHGRSPAHRYRHAGTYKVTLTITYSNGRTQTVRVRVVIRASRRHRRH